jgi:hypothetical protein
MKVGTKYPLFVYSERGRTMPDSCGNNDGCKSHPTIRISASFVPSAVGWTRTVYLGRRGADVVMASV